MAPGRFLRPVAFGLYLLKRHVVLN
jgi:hypothetical protein